jgi:DNA-binding MarR family transcriptional regulator
MKVDVFARFGFLASEVSKLYGDQFDLLAREQIGLSRAQCRLLSVLAMAKAGPALSQVELAQRLDLSPMAVATLCDRMESAGWIRRVPSPTDRRVNNVQIEAKADDALRAAMRLGDSLTTRALAQMTAAERVQIIALLQKARDGLLLASAAAQKKCGR